MGNKPPQLAKRSSYCGKALLFVERRWRSRVGWQAVLPEPAVSPESCRVERYGSLPTELSLRNEAEFLEPLRLATH